MGWIRRSGGGPAIVIAIIALIAAVAGTAVADKGPAASPSGKADKAQKTAKRALKKAKKAIKIAKAAAGSPDSPAQVLDKLTQVDGAGSQLDSDRVDGVDSTQLLRYGSTIPSGATVTGLFYGGVRPDTASAVRDFQLSESFPLPAPADVTAVNFAPDGFATTTDDDPTCTGSSSNPTAPPGKVCLYFRGSGGSTATALGTTLPGAARFGFGVNVTGTGGNSFVSIFGIWAYTAP